MSLSDAIDIILQEAERRIDLGDCYDRKLTKIHKNSRWKSSHISVGKILPYPEWRRVRIVKIPAGEDAVILVVKRLKVAEGAGDEG